MLENGESRLIAGELRHQADSRVNVEQIVIAYFLAMEFVEIVVEASGKETFLMGIFAITHGDHAVDSEAKSRRAV